MTSNLGATAAAPFGLSRSTSPAYDSEVSAFFRPEFFNRIDAVVTFDPLSPETIRAITEKELKDLATREGLSRLGIQLTWSDRLLDHLSTEGYDPRYGAPPLQCAIESLIVTPLARYLVNHPSPKTTRLHLDLDPQDQVTIEEFKAP